MSKQDRSDWIEVTAIMEEKVVIPEWDTFVLRVGQTYRMPKSFVSTHGYLFGLAEGAVSNHTSYVDAVLGVKQTKRPKRS